MNLDERMRRRIRAVAEEANRVRPGLTAEVVERISRRAAEEAIRRAQRRRITNIGLSITAMAAATLIYVRVSNQSSTEPLTASAPEVVAPRCATRSPGFGFETSNGAARHEIDARARLDFVAGSRALVAAPNGCASSVELVRGSVAVWARDLGGGSLIVHSGDVSIEVHGTTFEVRSDDDGSVYVAVDEGRVAVDGRGQHHVLTADQSLRIAADGTPTLSRPDDLAEQRLRGVHTEVVATAAVPPPEAAAVTPVRQAPAVPPADPASLLRDAERAYREGRVDEARAMFRQVGAGRGALAEAAFIRLGRLEMRSGRAAEAARALSDHRRRFPSGSLAAEARTAEAQALRSLGRASEAETLERWVVEHRPDSPQASAIRTRDGN